MNQKEFTAFFYSDSTDSNIMQTPDEGVYD